MSTACCVWSYVSRISFSPLLKTTNHNWNIHLDFGSIFSTNLETHSVFFRIRVAVLCAGFFGFSKLYDIVSDPKVLIANTLSRTLPPRVPDFVPYKHDLVSFEVSSLTHWCMNRFLTLSRGASRLVRLQHLCLVPQQRRRRACTRIVPTPPQPRRLPLIKTPLGHFVALSYPIPIPFIPPSRHIVGNGVGVGEVEVPLVGDNTSASKVHQVSQEFEFSIWFKDDISVPCADFDLI